MRIAALLLLAPGAAALALGGCAILEHPDARLSPPPAALATNCSPTTATIAVDRPEVGPEELVVAVKQHYSAGALASSATVWGPGTRVEPADALDAVGGLDRWLPAIRSVAASTGDIGETFGATRPVDELITPQSTRVVEAGTGDFLVGRAAPAVSIPFGITCEGRPAITGAVTAPYSDESAWEVIGCSPEEATGSDAPSGDATARILLSVCTQH